MTAAKKVMTKDDAQTRIAALHAELKALEKENPELAKIKGKHERKIKCNKNGGLYVVDPTFKAWSEAKQKTYIAGINMDMNVAKALFNNEELLDQVREFINAQ